MPQPPSLLRTAPPHLRRPLIIPSPYPGLPLRFSSPNGLLTFAAVNLPSPPAVPRRETDETFFSHQRSANPIPLINHRFPIRILSVHTSPIEAFVAAHWRYIRQLSIENRTYTTGLKSQATPRLSERLHHRYTVVRIDGEAAFRRVFFNVTQTE